LVAAIAAGFDLSSTSNGTDAVFVLDAVGLASNGSAQMLPNQAGKSRYRVRSRSPARPRCAWSVA